MNIQFRPLCIFFSSFGLLAALYDPPAGSNQGRALQASQIYVLPGHRLYCDARPSGGKLIVIIINYSVDCERKEHA